jgi:hypothetical protein
VSRLQAGRAGQAAVTLIVRLQLLEETVVDPDRVPQVLGSPEAGWHGEATPSDDPSLRSFLCDLELHAGGGGRTLFRKAAVVSFGMPSHDGERWVVPIEWRAASMTALFPVFAGQLRIELDRIELDGRYAPPAGRIGYMLDAALVGAAARQTGRWFLRELAAALA